METITPEALVARAKEGDADALESLLAIAKDDVYRLALRMLGLRADAEDATQEILIKLLTHLSEFRGESAFRTWVYRIAVRDLMRAKRSRREEIASLETIDMLIARGDERPPMPAFQETELALLAQEVRLSCTQGMVLSLDREHRISWILAEVFELSSEDAALVLGVDAATHRKRLSRARERLGEWMGRRCGLVNESNGCNCRRQVPVALSFDVANLGNLQYAASGAAPDDAKVTSAGHARGVGDRRRRRGSEGSSRLCRAVVHRGSDPRADSLRPLQDVRRLTFRALRRRLACGRRSERPLPPRERRRSREDRSDAGRRSPGASAKG